MKLLHFQSTLIEDNNNTGELDEAIKHARDFAGYHEDDGTEPLCIVHHHEDEDDEYFGKWTVDRDNKGPEADPTESEMVAGPFDTETEALAAAFDLDEQSAPHIAEYELPEGVSLIHADTGSSRSRFGHNASVIVRFNGEDYEGESGSDGSYGRMSASESGSIVVALDRAVSEAIGTEWEALDMSASAVAAREADAAKAAAQAEQDAKAKALGFQFARRFTSSEVGFRQMQPGQERTSSRGIHWQCIEAGQGYYIAAGRPAKLAHS